MAILAFLWVNPSIILNRSTLALLAEHARKQGWIDVQWSDLSVNIENAGFWDRRMALSARDICFNIEGRKAHVCAKHLNMSMAAGLRGFRRGLRVELLEAGPLEISGGTWETRDGLKTTRGSFRANTRGDLLIARVGQGPKYVEAAFTLPNSHTLRSSNKRIVLQSIQQTYLSEIPPLEVRNCYGEQTEAGWNAACVLNWKSHAEVEAEIVSNSEGLLYTVKGNIRHFGALKELLSKTQWAVPAPFHVLEGDVTTQARGTFVNGSASTTLSLSTHLRSELQRVNMEGEGSLSFKVPSSGTAASPHLSASVTLSDVVLELPRLSLSKPPRVFADKRLSHKPFAGAPPDVPSSNPLKISLRIHNPAGHPVQFISNLGKTPIPVDLNLEVGNTKPISGTIHVAQFPLQLFRRDALVESFQIALAQPLDESQLQGKIQVSYVDYKISVLLLSTVGKPVIRLISNPPLPEDQLLAVLLFGRPLEALSSEGGDSVGSARAAIADRAMSLVSLYALASTPVESVRYDPVSKSLVAKVRIADGTSLDVGANTKGLQELGIRRRLNSRWTLSTELSNPMDDRIMSTFLEWSKRY